jgi:hypothetical protein
VVLLIVSAALYKPILGRTKQSRGTDSTSPQSVPANTPTGSALASPDIKKTAPPVVTPPGRPTSSVPASQTPTIDIGKELDNAERESRREDKAAALSAIHRIETIEDRLVSSMDILRAGVAKADAWLTLRDKDKACTALSNVKDRASGTTYQSKVDALLLAC